MKESYDLAHDWFYSPMNEFTTKEISEKPFAFAVMILESNNKKATPRNINMVANELIQVILNYNKG